MPPAAYLTAARATTLLGERCIAADPRITAWAALSDADKAVLLAQATADIDAVLWLGLAVASPPAPAWPRLWPSQGASTGPGGSRRTIDTTAGGGVTRVASGYVDPDTAPHASDPYPSAPLAVKAACAVQAATRALEARGVGASARLEEAARRGVTSQGSGGGRAETIDLRVAAHPWARLCPDAQRLLGRYRAAGAEVLA